MTVRVLVTGADGRIGRSLRSHLSAEPALEGVYAARLPNSPAGDSIACDLTDTDQLRRLIDRVRPNAVIHLAGLSGEGSEAEYTAANVDATRQLAAESWRLGATRFIFASSAAVYGDGYRRRVSELDEPHPKNGYGRSKLAAELSLKGLADAEDRAVVFALRLFNIFGPGFDDSLVNRLCSSTVPVELRGMDSFVRDYVHVRDVTAAMITALSVPANGFNLVNIGSGAPMSNRQLLDALAWCRPKYRVVDAPPSYSCADISRAQVLLDYRVRVTPESCAMGSG